MICTITELPLWRVTNHDRSKENLSRVPNQSQIQIERNSYKTSGFRPNQTIFAKKSVVRWAERSPGKRGLVGWIGDEETASGSFDSEAEN